jgi:hypothetical protein
MAAAGRIRRRRKSPLFMPFFHNRNKKSRMKCGENACENALLV